MNRKPLITLTIAALVALALPAQAQLPFELTNLTGIRASSGEQELENLGYFHRNTITVRDSRISYWWSPSEQLCIAVTTTDGRYESIIEQPEVICDDDLASVNNDDFRSYDRPEDLVGIRASSGEQELENMGYALYNTITVRDSRIGYWWNRREQHCLAVTTRNGSYQSIVDQPEALCGEDQGSSNSGFSNYDDPEDLVGLRASSGESELENMGYYNYNTITVSDSRLSYWWNQQEQRCIVVTTKDGSYQSIVDQPQAVCGQ